MSCARLALILSPALALFEEIDGTRTGRIVPAGIPSSLRVFELSASPEAVSRCAPDLERAIPSAARLSCENTTSVGKIAQKTRRRRHEGKILRWEIRCMGPPAEREQSRAGSSAATRLES